MKRRILWMLLDLVAAALCIAVIWLAEYKLPQKNFSANMAEVSASDAGAGQELRAEETQATPAQDWHEKFADKFSDRIIATDSSYRSPNLAIQLSYKHYDTGIVDESDFGKHKKYGTKISYVLADIYVGDIACFQTAFAQDSYGVGYSEKLSDMSERMRAVLAVNGDSYSNNRHRDNGTIIRNGTVYRNQPTSSETCWQTILTSRGIRWQTASSSQR